MALPEGINFGLQGMDRFKRSENVAVVERRILEIVGHNVLIDPSLLTTRRGLQEIQTTIPAKRRFVSTAFRDEFIRGRPDQQRRLLARQVWRPFGRRLREDIDDVADPIEVAAVLARLEPFSATPAHIRYLEEHYPGPWNRNGPRAAFLMDTWSFLASHSGVWSAGKRTFSELRTKGIAVLDLPRQKLETFKAGPSGPSLKRQLSILLAIDAFPSAHSVEIAHHELLAALAGTMIVVLDP